MTQRIDSDQFVVRSSGSLVWTAMGDSLLGTMPDSKLASMLKIARTSVLNRRVELSISAFVTQKAYKWSEWEINLLGTLTDVEVGLATGKASGIVQKKRLSLHISRFGSIWTEENISLLGTMFDSEVAERTGFSIKSVLCKRLSLGIKPFKFINWTKQMIDLIGTMSDLKVAKAIGVSDSAVFLKRKALEIRAAN